LVLQRLLHEQRCPILANLSQHTRDEICAEAREFGGELPILVDEAQLAGESLGLQWTAEVLLIETKGFEIFYRGPIDDRLNYETEQKRVSHNYLVDANAALVKCDKPKESVVKGPGCLISYPAKQRDERKGVSYTKVVAPLLKAKWVDCHTKGGIGPFALSSHRKARGWSEMMREVVMTRRMPPWHADARHGKFHGDLTLTAHEQQQLVHWVEQGPEGGESDPLANYQPSTPEWVLGRPDAIVEIPTQELPAKGVLPYRYVELPSPFDRDVWINGVDVRSGNTRVLHHVIATIRDPKSKKKRGEEWLTGFAPGTQPAMFPEDTGIPLQAGKVLRFQLHYTTSGKAETDRTRLGLYVSDIAPKARLRTKAISDNKFLISAHDRACSWKKATLIKRDVMLYGLNLHMHFRGKKMRFELKHPDGRSETLLSVPAYNFNWQRTYVLKEPRVISSGCVLTLHATWDNSILNPANPDPERDVKWGAQTFDEMFFATFVHANLSELNAEDKSLSANLAE